MTGKKGRMNMIKWKDVKNSMQSIDQEEMSEIELISDIISQIILKRNELGISQRELEELSGIKQEAICRIETMKNIPQINTLLKIMIPLGLTLSVTPK
jgi:DNA-binding XRE family transcriptional regulator